MAIKFGRKQLDNPTPRGIDFWMKVYIAVAGVFLGWMQTNSLIGVHAQATVSSILGLTISLAVCIAPFFGVPIKSDTIPTEDAAVVEEKKD